MDENRSDAGHLTKPAREHQLKPCTAQGCNGQMFRSDDARLVERVPAAYEPGHGPIWLCDTCGELEWIDPTQGDGEAHDIRGRHEALSLSSGSRRSRICP
jgi:hypothetical protein